MTTTGNGAVQKQVTDAQVEDAREASVQSIEERFGTAGVAIGMLYWLANSGEVMPPWWSKERDRELRSFWKRSDTISGAVATIQSKIGTIPFEVRAKDRTVKSHVTQAVSYTDILKGATFGRDGQPGWQSFIEPVIEDYTCQDNGFFVEVIGPGRPDGPITGAPVSMRHLDSWRCDRTGDDEFPVLYRRRDGRSYKLHHTRVIYKSQMPSASEEMFGVGFCSLSRCVDMAQTFIDMAIYKQEKLGSRPPRQFLLGKGISLADIQKAVNMAAEQYDNAGLKIFANTVFLGSEDPDVGLDQIDMAQVPDHFDEMQQFQIGMAIVALAFGVDVRDLAWAMGVAGQTKADAEIQHLKARGKAVGNTLQMLEWVIEYKFLPPHLELKFDFQDDEQDRAQAEIRSTRSTVRKADLEAGVTTERVARQQMLRDKDIDEAQFEELELADGRLADGAPVTSLFYVENDQRLEDLLDVGVENPLDTEANEADAILPAIKRAKREAEAAWMNGSTGNIRRTARRAAAALEALREMYAGSGEEMDSPMPGQADAPGGADRQTDGDDEQQQPPQFAASDDDEEVDDENGDEIDEDEVKQLLTVGAHAGGVHYEEPCAVCGRWIEAGDARVVKSIYGWRIVCDRHEVAAETAYAAPEFTGVAGGAGDRD